MNWGTPTEEMLAALTLARRCGRKHRGGLNEIQLAELIMGAKESLWYLQAQGWAKMAPTAVAESSRPMFQTGCATVVRIVDSGYDPEIKQWWNVRKLYSTEDQWVIAMMVLMDLGAMTQRLPNVAEWPEGTTREEVVLGTVQRGFTVVSGGFQIFVDLMCGPQWERQYEAMVQAVHEGKRLQGRRGT